MSSGIGRDAPAQEATARQALAVTQLHELIFDEQFE
jgi:hypothetical protein